MHHGQHSRPIAASKLWLPVLLLSPLLLAGCACRDGAPDEWTWDDRMADTAFTAPDAVEADGPQNPECRTQDLAQLSELSAELSARADPALLAAARRDVERACDRSSDLHRNYAEIK